MEKLKKILEAEIAQRKLAMKHNPLNKDEIAEELDELNIGLVKLFAIPNVRLSLPDAKQAVAEMYSKKDWAEVLRDYEYGLGISKMIGFEELMDKVAEVYKGNEA